MLSFFRISQHDFNIDEFLAVCKMIPAKSLSISMLISQYCVRSSSAKVRTPTIAPISLPTRRTTRRIPKPRLLSRWPSSNLPQILPRRVPTQHTKWHEWWVDLMRLLSLGILEVGNLHDSARTIGNLMAVFRTNTIAMRTESRLCET